MKLVIVNGENRGKTEEVNINEYLEVRDLKTIFDAKCGGHGDVIKYYYRFIYKNLILYENNFIKHYKISPNDEIWFGKIENYLKNDDVIVEIFLVGFIPVFIFMIIKSFDSISVVRSKLIQMYPLIFNIWNTKGDLLTDDQIVTDCDENEYYRLIINSSEIHYTFEDCLNIHDRSWFEQFLFWDQFRDENNDESMRKMLIGRLKQIRLIISSNDSMDIRLRNNINEFPSSFIKSKLLFYMDMTDRILEIFNDYWQLAKIEYGENINMFIDKYIRDSIEVAILNHLNSRRNHTDFIDKSINNIVLDALDYVIDYLTSRYKNWRYWIKLLLNQFLLKSFEENELDRLIKNFDEDQMYLLVKVNGNNHRMYINKKLETVIEAKNAISHLTEIKSNQMFCIKPGSNNKPCDNDMFDYRFIFEIALSMEDMKKLNLLGEGGFGAVYLYQDQITMEKFVVKKQRNIKDDLYREISIQSQLQLSQYIQCYSGLLYNNGKIYMTMKYMSKGSLEEYLKAIGPFPENEIARICYHLLLQIKELHLQQIIHRDINSKNIVFDDLNNPKLIDFGISKNTDGISAEQLSENLKKYINGNLRYMAPEYLNAQPYSIKIDIWSLGAVTIEMLTGLKPYPNCADHMAAFTIGEKKKIPYKSSRPISKDLEKFIILCLIPNPELRSNAEYLMQTLFIKNYSNTIKK